MKFAGIQKVTLLDYPEHIASTLFTRGCNLRCVFCHNKELIPFGENPNDIDEQFVIDFLKERKGKIQGICISGGEPLFYDDIFEFAKKVKNEGFKIKIDTNGYHPKKIEKLIDESLVDCFAMDIKSSKENYEKIIGVKLDFEKIEESINILKKGKVDYEFRTTCVKHFHEEKDFYGIGELIQGANKYFLQNFREVEGVTPKGMEGFKKEELEVFKGIAEKYVKRVEIRGID